MSKQKETHDLMTTCGQLIVFVAAACILIGTKRNPETNKVKNDLSIRETTPSQVRK